MNKAKQQSGFTAIEYVAIVAVIAIATIGIIAATGGFFGSNKKNTASLEATQVINGAKAWRTANNTMTGISMTALDTGGYDIGRLDGTAGENSYGQSITVAVNAGNSAIADFTYGTDDPSACAALVTRLSQMDGVSAAACTGTPAVTFGAQIQ